MKIAMINTSDRQGGAAVAASRLKEALTESGIEVKLIVRDKLTADPNVISVNTGLFRRQINRLRFLWERSIIFLHNGFSRQRLFKVSIADTGMDISRMPEVRQADIIHLHWTNHGYISLKGIRNLLALGKPVVWTLHDMWAATGICHYAWECERYTEGCGRCPFLGSSNPKDLSTKVFRKKQAIYNDRINLTPVSRWLEGICRASALTRRLPVGAIPNPIDTDFFSPGDRTAARREAELPIHGKIILMGAARIDDPVKGFSKLKEALKELPEEIQNSVLLVLFGGLKDEKAALADIPVKYTWLGRISDAEKLRALYRSADAFLAPSMEDNLPNTVMESLACGTPVAGFRTGGIPEMVDHLENGCLAPRGDASELAKSITWILEHLSPVSLSEQSRAKVMSHFTIERVARQYTELYKSLLSEKK